MEEKANGLKNTEWIYLPFIVLSRVYIRFYDGKKDFWIVLPSFLLSLIISLNLYVLINLKYEISIYWIFGLYLLLYFVLFFIFNKKFPDFKSVGQINLSTKQKGVALTIVGLGVFSFVLLLNLLRESQI